MSALKRISNPPETGAAGPTLQAAARHLAASRRGGYPLPDGMHDLLPPQARQLSRVGRGVSDCFARFGYQRVTLPSFEYASVLEKARGNLESAMLRFVEPETGEVVALRPDMTLQVARLVSNRLAEAPMPARLSYHGSVLRRRHERARVRRQVTQAGFELVGVVGLPGDFEVLELLIESTFAVGLTHFTVDIAHAGITTALIEGLETERRGDVLNALVTKDSAELERRLRGSRLASKHQAALVALPRLQGGAELWPRAEQVLVGTPGEGPLRELQALWSQASSRGLEDRLLLDLGEPPSFDYYTGPVYQLLAGGPGEPIGAGGRYDRLYEMFGSPQPAAGFAFDLGNLCWALRAAGVSDADNMRLLLATSESAGGGTLRLLAGLRAARIACAEHPSEDSEAYARAWHFQFVLNVQADRVSLVELGPSDTTTLLELPWTSREPAVDPIITQITSAMNR